MARGRMISKAISLDEKVNSLSDDTARLLFTWLITHLDCEGRLHGDALTVKSIVFPRRNISPKRIEKYLSEFEKNGLIIRYGVNGNAYLFLPHFEKHQTGLQKRREAQSQIPPFTLGLIKSKVRQSHLQVKDEVKDTLAQIKPTTNNFEVFWKAYPKRKSKGDAEKVFAKVNPDDKLLSTMVATIERAKKSEDWQKDGGKFIPYPATWLNAKGWEDEFTKQGGKSGTNRQNTRRLPDRDSYTKPEDYRG